MFIGVQLISAALGFTSSERVVERPMNAVALRVDSGATIARENLEMRDGGEFVVGTLTLTLTAKEVIAASTMLELPRGSRVIAMTLDHGDEVFRGRSLEVEEARRRFVETVEPPREIVVPRPPLQRDPALLEVEHSGASEHLRLTVFPVSSAAPATVKLMFATPRFDRMDVFANGHHRDALLRTHLAAATPEDSELALGESPLVFGRALYAAPLAAAPSEAELAKRFDEVLPTLARCAAVDDSSTTQHVSLRVDVDVLGRVSLRSSEGAGGYLLDCVHQVIDYVQFADDAATSLAVAFDVVPKSAPSPASL